MFYQNKFYFRQREVELPDGQASIRGARRGRDRGGRGRILPNTSRWRQPLYWLIPILHYDWDYIFMTRNKRSTKRILQLWINTYFFWQPFKFETLYYLMKIKMLVELEMLDIVQNMIHYCNHSMEIQCTVSYCVFLSFASYPT